MGPIVGQVNNDNKPTRGAPPLSRAMRLLSRMSSRVDTAPLYISYILNVSFSNNYNAKKKKCST